MGWAEKKRKGEGGRRVCGSFLAVGSSLPRFVIEGVSSTSENRGALLASTDLKMYPFSPLSLSLAVSPGFSPSFSLSLSLAGGKLYAADIEFKLRSDFYPAASSSLSLAAALFRG